MILLACAAVLALDLRSPDWTVTVDPATLAATASIGGRPFVLSAPQAGLGAMTALQFAGATATWRLGTLEVRMEIAAKVLRVHFASPAPGRFTWPVSGPPPPGVRYLIPRGEGLLMDPRDPRWRAKAWEREHEFLERFSLPLWGALTDAFTLTWLAANPFDNTFTYEDTSAGLGWRFTHEFKRHWAKKEFGFDVVLGSPSPVEPAREFRRRQIAAGAFVSLKDKIARTPEAGKLLGAPHAYLWSLGALALEDVRDWPALVRGLAASPHPLVQRIRAKLEPGALAQPRPYAHAQRGILLAIDGVLRDPPRHAELAAALPGVFAPVEQWGGGLSVRMLERLREKGFERLWLGVPTLSALAGRPGVARRARELGFLLGPYDSYDSIHAPGEPDTWETAQFDRDLFERGAVVGPDGKKVPGFQGKGYWLSSRAVRPWFERRTGATFAAHPFNSFFLDCDGTGFMHDNYAPAWLATQADDLRERLSRLRYVTEKFHVPVGSEDGIWTAAPVLHFAHGMLTPVFGWNDPRFRDKQSPHWLGAYWPPDAPSLFLQSVPLPEDFRLIYFDPATRIPLYQTAFHDSLVSTHHWNRPGRKFSNVAAVNELLELLYAVPPLVHLNSANLDAVAPALLRQYRFWAPLHRELALRPLTGFAWLTADRLVQRTVFGADEWELIANFGARPYAASGLSLPPRSVAARRLPAGAFQIYTVP